MTIRGAGWVTASLFLLFFLFLLPKLPQAFLPSEQAVLPMVSPLPPKGLNIEFFDQSLLHRTGLRAFAKLFNGRPWGIRLFPVLLVTVTAWILRAAVKRAVPPERAGQAGRFALGFFLLNPAVIQGATLVDSNATLWPLALSVFTWVLIYCESWSLFMRSIVLGLGFVLLLWTKISVALVLPLAFVPYVVLNRRPWMAFFFALGVCGFGFLLFALSWGVFCAITGNLSHLFLPAHGLWERAIHGLWVGFPQAHTPLREVIAISLWSSPFLLLLFGLGFMAQFSSSFQQHRSASIDLVGFITILWLGACVWLGGMAAQFPLQYLGLMPLLAFWAAYEVIARVDLTGSDPSRLAMIAFAGCAVLQAVTLPDLLLPYVRSEAGLFLKGMGWLLVFPFLSAVSARWMSPGIRGSPRRRLVLAGAAFAYFVVTNLAQLNAPYRTSTYYGQLLSTPSPNP